MFTQFTAAILASSLLFSGISANTVIVSKEDSTETESGEYDENIIQKGFEFISSSASAVYSAAVSNEYVEDICETVADLENAINDSVPENQTISSAKGFIAEIWHAGTLNIDAAVKKLKSFAQTTDSNEYASPDMTATTGEEAQSKYYSSASASAKAQTTTVTEKYAEYARQAENSGKEAMTLDQYCEKYGYDPQIDLYDSVYAGMQRIIPSDQLEDAIAYLEGRIDKLTGVDGVATEGTLKNLQETLDNLKDRMTTADGAASTPLSEEEAQAIAELAKTGEFQASDFGVSASDVITTGAIAKQALSTGITAAAISAAISVVPDIVEIIKNAASEEGVSLKDFVNLGIDGALGGTKGFTLGSVTSAVTTACKAGKFGTALTNASAPVVGALVVLVFDSVKYGFEFYEGNITASQYQQILTEELTLSAMGVGGAMLLTTLLPAVPLITAVGSVAATAIGTVVYSTAYQTYVQIRNEGGILVAAQNRLDAIAASASKIISSDTSSAVLNGTVEIKGSCAEGEGNTAGSSETASSAEETYAFVMTEAEDGSLAVTFASN